MKQIKKFRIKDYQWLNQDNYILEVEATDGILPDILPGNFAEVEVPDSKEVFLRRPFSILDANHEKGTLSFYIKAIGKGTRHLGNLSVGKELSIVFPLGNSFSLPENKKLLITGGGSGIAPFILLGRELVKRNNELTFLLGARSKNEIFLTEFFQLLGNVETTTEDGSMGEKGLITQHSIFANINNFDRIYTCGPDPMMKAIAQIAHKHEITCEASLENTMACGFGACLCCVTHTKDGNKCVCTDGPVFNTKYLEW